MNKYRIEYDEEQKIEELLLYRKKRKEIKNGERKS